MSQSHFPDTSGVTVNRACQGLLPVLSSMSKDEQMANMQGQWSIRGDHGSGELAELADWFRRDDELRGSVTVPRPQIRDGQMGDLYDVLIVAVSSGGVAAALARSLTTWLTYRRSDVKITVTRADGATYELDARRVKSEDVVGDIQKLLDPPDRL
ncbi:hypothetical protein ACFYT3_24940 [Nocardia amikacinitolerans]|uniref:effector-associated constant component EACC1 n=1 Tax=Nocardia amikacinitolerans TaxID=756689 RepID=UPI0036B7A47B